MVVTTSEGLSPSPTGGLTTRTTPTTLTVDAVLFGAALLGGWALVHLLGPSSLHQATVPVLVAAGGLSLAGAFVGRRTSPSALVVLGVPLVLLAATWVTVPGGTRWGVPTPTTVNVLHRAMLAARPSLATFSPPLAVDPGTVWLAAAAGAMAALSARTLVAAWSRRPGRPVGAFPLTALAPATALVAWSCVVRADVRATLLVTALSVLGVAAVAIGTDRGQRGSGRRPWWRPARAGVAGVAGACVLVAIGAGVATRPARLSSSRPGAVASLLLEDRVAAAGQRDPGLVVFTARPAVQTYWQIATLSRFRGDRWRAGPGVGAAADGRPLHAGSAPQPTVAAGHTGTQAITVTLGAYQGPLLPAPPRTVSVSPASVMTVDASDGVVLRRGSGTSPTLFRYTVGVSVGTRSGGTAGPAATRADLALPPLPPVIVTLAHHIVDGASSPIARVRALLSFFATGDFRYVADPPPAPAGVDPLTRFLTTDRQGSCEQFAGAFAVLARVDGLPARVAVGFTAGSVTSGGVTVVRGSDAHAWPEVYLGTSLGWQAVEPTPAAGDGSMVPASVLRASTGTEPPGTIGGHPEPVTGSAPSTTRPVTTPTTARTPTPLAPAPRRAPEGTPSGRSRIPTGLPKLVLAIGGGVVLAVAALVLLGHRTRQWRRSRRYRRRGWGAPESEVLAAWAVVERQFDRSGQARPPERTATAHARVVGSGLPSAAAADLALVARAFDAVLFAPDPVAPGRAADVVETARRLRPVLAPSAGRRPGR